MKMKELETTTSHINTFRRVLEELSSQGMNFEEEVKALMLLLSLPASWEVLCTTFTNSLQKLMLNEAIGMILLEEIRRISLGLSINDNVEAHFLADTAQRTD